MWAPTQDIDTSSWLTSDGLSSAASTLGSLGLFTTGWGLFGTALAVITRSVPVGLGIGLLWAGPVENILGDDLTWAAEWFPGLLLRELITPDPVVETWRVAITLVGYAAVAAVVIAVSNRRDVTA